MNNRLSLFNNNLAITLAGIPGTSTVPAVSTSCKVTSPNPSPVNDRSHNTGSTSPTATTLPPVTNADLATLAVRPSSPDIVGSRLYRCMLSVQQLAGSIESALRVWQGSSKDSSSDIQGSYAEVVAEMALLPNELQCIQCTGRVPWSQLDPSRSSGEPCGTCVCPTRGASPSLWKPCDHLDATCKPQNCHLCRCCYDTNIHPDCRSQAPASYSCTDTPFTASPDAARVESVAETPWSRGNTYFPYPSYFEQQNPWLLQEQHYASQRPFQNLQQPEHTRSNAKPARSPPPRPYSPDQGFQPTIRITTEQPCAPDAQTQPQDFDPASATPLHAPYTFDNTTCMVPSPRNAWAAWSDLNTTSDVVQLQGPPPQIGPRAPQYGVTSPISEHPALSRPTSPSDVSMDPNVRKRSSSEIWPEEVLPPLCPTPLQMLPTEHEDPPIGFYECSPGLMENSGHKVQRMIKRGDPPQANNGKYYCNFSSECADQYFDRKCEWRQVKDDSLMAEWQTLTILQQTYGQA